MATCIRCFVSGRVQGVFFRASTRDVALRLGIAGYARNLPDRRVEVLACGEAAPLQELRQWLEVGPQYAEVKAVSCEDVEPGSLPTSFSIE